MLDELRPPSSKQSHRRIGDILSSSFLAYHQLCNKWDIDEATKNFVLHLLMMTKGCGRLVATDDEIMEVTCINERTLIRNRKRLSYTMYKDDLFVRFQRKFGIYGYHTYDLNFFEDLCDTLT